MMSVQPHSVGVVNPWKMLRDMPHVEVVWADLPGSLLGYCDHDTDTIYMRRGMRQRQRRAVLLHELTHLARGKVFPQAHLRMHEENAVEQETARDFISTSALIEALAESQDEWELAERLWVDVATVRDRLAGLSEAERKFISDEIDRREIHIP